MNFTKLSVTLYLFVLGVFDSTTLASPFYIPMKASFSEVTTDKAPCDLVFAKKSYDIDFHILNQPRGAIIRFKNEEGFFGASNIVARRGYDDLFFEKTTEKTEFPNVTFKIKGEGIYNTDLVLLDFEVEAHENTNPRSPALCAVKAQFFASQHNNL